MGVVIETFVKYPGGRTSAAIAYRSHAQQFITNANAKGLYIVPGIIQ
jgi:hypothetical protein